VFLLPKANVNERKTVLKAFRFSESLARSLEKEAADQGISVSALVNSIAREHYEWGKKVSEFGFAEVPKSLFKAILAGVDDEKLARIGREVVPTLWKEMAEFWTQDSSPEGILRFQTLRSKFNPANQTKVTQEEGNYTIVLRHDFGPKWSVIVKNGLQETVKELFHVEPRFSQGDSVVMARFKVNPRKSPT
jgi:hypothetical protein